VNLGGGSALQVEQFEIGWGGVDQNRVRCLRERLIFITVGLLDVLPDRRSFFESVAAHEAGHCTVARLVGLSVAGVSVDDIDGHHGGALVDDANRASAPAETTDLVATLQGLMPKLGENRDSVAVDLLRCHDLVLVSLAGAEAELLFGGPLLPNTAHDLIEARALASLLCRSPTSIDAYIEFARCEVRELLSTHVGILIAVAAALIRRRSLTGSEIDWIVRRSCADDRRTKANGWLLEIQRAHCHVRRKFSFLGLFSTGGGCCPYLTPSVLIPFSECPNFGRAKWIGDFHFLVEDVRGTGPF
jgi:hypothetical protein